MDQAGVCVGVCGAAKSGKETAGKEGRRGAFHLITDMIISCDDDDISEYDSENDALIGRDFEEEERGGCSYDHHLQHHHHNNQPPNVWPASQ